MTGAQEQALTRLKKRHRDLYVEAQHKDHVADIQVSWTKATDWGVRTVSAHVTPEGRVVEQSS